MHIYQKQAGKWTHATQLSQHDLLVTSIDWAKKSNRIVTCSAVSVGDVLYPKDVFTICVVTH